MRKKSQTFEIEELYKKKLEESEIPLKELSPEIPPFTYKKNCYNERRRKEFLTKSHIYDEIQKELNCPRPTIRRAISEMYKKA